MVGTRKMRHCANEEAAPVTIRVTGWRAVALLLAITAALAGYGWHRHGQMTATLDEAANSLRLQIMAEYARANMPLMDKVRDGSLSREEMREAAEKIAGDTRVEIESLEMRGGFLGTPLFRVEYTVDGETPPDGDRVRYYTMRHTFLAGWSGMARRRPAFLWYFALWR